MPTCTHCNISLPADAKFCPRCGRARTPTPRGLTMSAVLTVVALIVFVVVLMVFFAARGGPPATVEEWPREIRHEINSHRGSGRDR